MYRFVLVLALATLAFGLPAAKKSSKPVPGTRIVGGVDTDIKDVPYQLSLRYAGSHICGASILSEKWAVTAGHCTDGSSASSLTIVAGSSDITKGGETIKIKAIHQNPKFDDANIDWDISVLELASPITLSANAKAVGLPTLNQEVPEGTVATVSGWGTLNEGDWDLPSQLQSVQVPIVSNKKCNDAYGAGMVTDRMICAGVTEGGVDSCQGDSGGPLVIDGTLTGIVSWGYGCARPNYPGVYASVPAMRDYITEIASL